MSLPNPKAPIPSTVCGKDPIVFFTCSKNCCYKTLTLICALPIAFISGCTFACLTFQHIWCVSPALRQCRINCYMVRQYLTSVLDSCLGPCCSEMGLCLSRIRIGRYQLTSSEVGVRI
ncbi:caveolin [Trichonephila clavata]|uniref:Caveolin n=1 Tax=Trichonephila clavata TaxID=2740835 RepID=A0A8X6HQZ7_TRICU|nr:caveolin [Trichonephila clavata]